MTLALLTVAVGIVAFSLALYTKLIAFRREARARRRGRDEAGELVVRVSRWPLRLIRRGLSGLLFAILALLCFWAVWHQPMTLYHTAVVFLAVFVSAEAVFDAIVTIRDRDLWGRTIEFCVNGILIDGQRLIPWSQIHASSWNGNRLTLIGDRQRYFHPLTDEQFKRLRPLLMAKLPTVAESLVTQ